MTIGSLLLKGRTVAVTGDGAAAEALLLLSWVPAADDDDDVSDVGGLTEQTGGNGSGSHFPVIINTRAI